MFTLPKVKSVRHWFQKVCDGWERWRHLAFFLALVGVLIWGGWEWYRSLYLFSWTAAERSQYIDSKLQVTQFNEAKFQAALDSLAKRQEAFNNVPTVGRDIFKK